MNRRQMIHYNNRRLREYPVISADKRYYHAGNLRKNMEESPFSNFGLLVFGIFLSDQTMRHFESIVRRV